MGWYHRCMLVDPNGNINNHDAVLIDRALYRANAALYALHAKVSAEIAKIAKEATP